MKTIKIVIAGPRGKMGKACVNMITQSPHFQLVSVLDRKYDREKIANIDPSFSHLHTIPVFTNIDECLAETKPDVFIDLTRPEAAFHHARTAIHYGVRPIIGTTGLTSEQLNELKQLANEKRIGCIIAPNFAIGAILMMKFSQMAAKYFSDVEIIELHHDQKLDAPSGTAVKTAEMILEERGTKKQGHSEEKETISGARGAEVGGLRIHSVRLPGLIAHQQVIFGSKGETLTIRHDSYDRSSFMHGIQLSIKAIMSLEEYVYGLENILQ